nr:class I SAM-dependent methyltransferase [Polynucleobacter meluiroseus]
MLEASSWVRRFTNLIPKGGAILDLACGSGRHAHFFAQSAYKVLAVDRDIAAIEDAPHPLIEVRSLDLETTEWPLLNQQFSAIVVTNYLYRPHLDQLPAMLMDGGILIYETFAEGNGAFGKPSNPNFLLNTGELLALAARHHLKVIAYEDIYQEQPKPAMIQRLCAVKGRLK